MPHSYSLGPLEKQVMNAIWNDHCETGKQVWEEVGKPNNIAYTTIMTIMNRLVTKGFLTKCKLNRKTYLYKSSQSKQQNLRSVINTTLDMWINTFGEEAVATFISEADRIAHQKKEKS